MPLDYREENSGRCGCPSGLRWNLIAQNCLPIAGQVCYSSNEEEREGIGLCMFRWFTQSWWGDRFNIDRLQNCFRWHRDNEPITQSCCPYITYDGKEYGEYVDIEVY